MAQITIPNWAEEIERALAERKSQAQAMTVADVDARTAEIGKEWTVGNDRRARDLDDQLRLDVLLAVTHGNPRSQELATRALRTMSFDIRRDCSIGCHLVSDGV